MTTRTAKTERSGEPRRETLLTDFTLVALSPEERRRAALTVCRSSETVDEARELLSALGLLDDEAIRGAA
ncbi:MAG TPA: hypothetical protein VHC43_07950 [Mycobacteriales bacterium]|nr:hypothetical protein [Mycobacteriales bacterium]